MRRRGELDVSSKIGQIKRERRADERSNKIRDFGHLSLSLSLSETRRLYERGVNDGGSSRSPFKSTMEKGSRRTRKAVVKVPKYSRTGIESLARFRREKILPPLQYECTPILINVEE